MSLKVHVHTDIPFFLTKKCPGYVLTVASPGMVCTPVWFTSVEKSVQGQLLPALCRQYQPFWIQRQQCGSPGGEPWCMQVLRTFQLRKWTLTPSGPCVSSF